MRAWLLATVALALAVPVLPGVVVHGGASSILVVAAPIGLPLAMIAGIARALAVPALTVVLALAGWALEAVLVLLADALLGRLEVSGFWTAVWAGLALTAVAGAVSWLVDPAAT